MAAERCARRTASECPAESAVIVLVDCGTLSSAAYCDHDEFSQALLTANTGIAELVCQYELVLDFETTALMEDPTLSSGSIYIYHLRPQA